MNPGLFKALLGHWIVSPSLQHSFCRCMAPCMAPCTTDLPRSISPGNTEPPDWSIAHPRGPSRCSVLWAERPAARTGVDICNSCPRRCATRISRAWTPWWGRAGCPAMNGQRQLEDRGQRRVQPVSAPVWDGNKKNLCKKNPQVGFDCKTMLKLGQQCCLLSKI